MEQVDIQVKHIPQSQFDTEVTLGNSFPCQVINTDFSFSDTFTIVALSVGTPLISLCIGDKGSKVSKTATTNIIITSLTDAGAELNLMEDGLHLLHERLLAQQPSNSYRWEETKALTLSKILRTIVTEVKLSHIAVIIGSRKTACYTLLSIVLNATIVVGLLVVEHHGVNICLTETMTIHQVCFKIHTRVTIFIPLLTTKRLITCFVL